jgi:hypothetical protein
VRSVLARLPPADQARCSIRRRSPRLRGRDRGPVRSGIVPGLARRACRPAPTTAPSDPLPGRPLAARPSRIRRRAARGVLVHHERRAPRRRASGGAPSPPAPGEFTRLFILGGAPTLTTSTPTPAAPPPSSPPRTWSCRAPCRRPPSPHLQRLSPPPSPRPPPGLPSAPLGRVNSRASFSREALADARAPTALAHRTATAGARGTVARAGCGVLTPGRVARHAVRERDGHAGAAALGRAPSPPHLARSTAPNRRARPSVPPPFPPPPRRSRPDAVVVTPPAPPPDAAPVPRPFDPFRPQPIEPPGPRTTVRSAAAGPSEYTQLIKRP